MEAYKTMGGFKERIMIQLTLEEAKILWEKEIEECTDIGTELRSKLFKLINSKTTYY